MNKLIAFTLFLLGHVVGYGQTIQNASFDDNSGVIGGGMSYTGDPSGPSVINDMPGWTVIRSTYFNNFDVNLNGTPRFPTVMNGSENPYATMSPQHGSKFFTVYVEGIKDLVSTQVNGTATGLGVGRRYEVSFWYAGMHDNLNGPTFRGEWQLSAAGQSTTVDAFTDMVNKTNADGPPIPPGQTYKQSPWKQGKLRFLASAVNHALNFVGLAQGGPAQVMLDNVQITAVCNISSVTTTPGACNNNGTPNDQSDDYYTADVKVDFTDRPSSGNLVLSGAALHATNSVTSTGVAAFPTSGSHTFTGVRLKANGVANAITATFSADAACTLTANASSVANCSVPICAMNSLVVTPGACNNNGTANDQNDDFYLASVTVNFTDKPASGNLVLSGAALHATNSVSTVAVGATTNANGHTYTNVRLKANGLANNLTATFSADIACTITIAATPIANCSPCTITSIAITPGSCNDSGTPNDQTDDYYSATVTVDFVAKPGSGNLVLSGSALHFSNSVSTVAVASTSTGTSHTFSGVRLKANGAANNLTATFSADALCTLTVAANVIPNCSPCTITSLVVTPGACNDNGTTNDQADDYYTATVTLNFVSKPASGNLVLSGAALHATNSVSTVAVGSTTTSTSHTFVGVRLKANNVANNLTGTFSADAACTLTTPTSAVANCSPCTITSLTVTPAACNNNGTANDQTDDYYTATVTVNYVAKPASGNLVLSGVALHSTNSVSTVAVGSTSTATTHVFAGVRLKANGVANNITATFSADPACTLTVAANAVANCSPCTINALAVTPGACNTNGTNNDEADDYYTATVTVDFVAKPSSGNLVLSGAALHSSNSVSTVAVGSTTSGTSHTYVGVRLKANGVANAITATFSADAACTITVNAPSIAECSTPDCGMVSMVVTPGACNDNGTTNDQGDDYYTANVTVNFQNKPASGNLVLSGVALHSSNSVSTVAVGSTTNATSHTFTGVRLKANGVTNALTATFSADVACTITVSATTVNNCSTPDCIISSLAITPAACNNNGTANDQTDDYYTASITVNFANKPASGNLVLSGVALHSTNSVSTVAVGSTSTATTHVFAGVRLKANGVANNITATFSADPACTSTASSPLVVSCSTPDCAMTDIAVTPGACSDNGTPNDATDDYYTASVTATFANKPATGNLVLSGAALHSANSVSTVAVGSTTSATTHTFVGVRLKANGAANNITATFSADPTCTLTEPAPAVASCSTPDCDMTDIVVTPGVCNSNGTNNDETDDYYSADVTISFANKPATGNLVLSGVALHSTNSVTTVAVGSTTSATSHTFVGVRLKANNIANAITATFSADPLCTRTVNAPPVNECSDPDCDMTDIVVTPGACNDNGTPNDSTDDYYTGTVTVSFLNKPVSGNLVLSGVALHSSNSVATVSVGSTTTATSHTFVGVRLKANNVANAITATFSADPACTATVNASVVSNCSVPPVECCPHIILGAP